ncbi:hypothetical protein [Agrococcus carbonis]|uniref:DUF559 domain-containing protein n=1 Tax=Agrococcus carbonis TaxID=684552 RepID=A0A1H1S1Y8_9MICO|nr:hypothetical protein [Agrococcus carbonis]SDS42017.1 hypothetical protein SAMN04489719_2279 [Agrococcus carbonis]
MPAKQPLPEPFHQGAFRVRDAMRAGVSADRLRHGSLIAPFRQVRAHAIDTVLDLSTAYATVMAAHHAFGGITAARLWGLPIAERWTKDEPLVIARPRGSTRGFTRGTRHIAVDPVRTTVVEVDGLRLLDPWGTTRTLARELSHEALVQVLDALLTPSQRYPGLALRRDAGRPWATPERLAALLRRDRGLAGVAALRAAAAHARVGVDSRFETIVRLLLVEAGLPEPAVHPLVVVDGIESRPDLGYPDSRIAIEYEGDGHREERQWHVDIDRYARLESAGWITIRVTRAHMARRGAHFVQRVRAALARRAPGSR